MSRRGEDVTFAEEAIQVSTRETEEGAWRKDFTERMARKAQEDSTGPQINLEQAMDAVKTMAGSSKRIDQVAYESVSNQLAEEKDRVSLSQWLVNEGIEMSGVEAIPETPGEQLKDEVIKDVTREPLAREGARARRPYQNWLKHFKRVGDKVGAVTLIDIQMDEYKRYLYSFTHSDYPGYVLGIQPTKGWRVGTEESGWLSKQVPEPIPVKNMNEGMIEELLDEGGAKRERTERDEKRLTEEEKSMASGILQAYFDMTPEEAQAKMDTETPENIRWLNHNYDPYKPLDVDPETKQVRKPEREPGILSARQL